jgi:hypothetical protein
MFAEGEDILLYDSPDVRVREPITREEFLELPLYDTDNELLRVFDAGGWEISRRRALYKRTTQPFGGLVDLRKIHELFGPPSDEDEADGPLGTQFQAYPQAGLLSCGHVVAKGLLYPYNNFIGNLNDSLSQPEYVTEDDVSDDGQNRVPAVQGIASQIYNAMMHHTRGNSTQHHGVVLGNVTAALAGHWARSTTSTRTAEKFARKCDLQLPHEEYVQKITGRPLSRDLRVENVIGITMSSIHPANPARTSGRSFIFLFHHCNNAHDDRKASLQ